MTAIVDDCECREDPDLTDGEHESVCQHAPSGLTKGEVLDLLGKAGAATVDAYLFELAEFEDRDIALSAALTEIEETGHCLLGIGSCGRGWCKH